MFYLLSIFTFTVKNENASMPCDEVMATATIPGSRTGSIKKIIEEFGEKNVTIYKPKDNILCVVLMKIPDNFQAKAGEDTGKAWQKHVKNFCESI